MKDLVFATNNKNKLYEINQLLGSDFKIMGLAAIECYEDLPETQSTIEGNAREKAEYIHNKYKVDCFADDTALEIEALNGEPGVYTARYAGDNATYDENMDFLLKMLEGTADRKAKFRTVICLFSNGKDILFEGSVEGVIAKVKTGEKGFGYDPLFVPDGYDVSFAEMSMEEKNKISHRGKAIRKLADHLNNN